MLTPAESLHSAIAHRAFGFTGPFSTPARLIHDRITQTAYRAVRKSAATTTTIFSSAVGVVTGEDARVLTRSRRGRAVVAALNGLAGDLLEEKRNDLAISMSVSGRRKRTPRIAIFLHGLGETRESWSRGRHEPFGLRLKADFGISPLYVTYNSGLRITDNGTRLNELVEDVVAAWPVRVKEIVLIGHSMGGLVALAGCSAGVAAGARWTTKVKHVVTLGSPHTGVPLEKMVHGTAAALRTVPEGRALADILDLRSAGIRDLRDGYLAPRLDGCTYTFITASVHRSPRHPLSWIAGDLLVRSSSAAGLRSGNAVAAASDNVYHLAPLTHFDLLDHPEVYRRIHEVLAAA